MYLLKSLLQIERLTLLWTVGMNPLSLLVGILFIFITFVQSTVSSDKSIIVFPSIVVASLNNTIEVVLMDDSSSVIPCEDVTLSIELHSDQGLIETLHNHQTVSIDVVGSYTLVVTADGVFLPDQSVIAVLDYSDDVVITRIDVDLPTPTAGGSISLNATIYGVDDRAIPFVSLFVFYQGSSRPMQWDSIAGTYEGSINIQCTTEDVVITICLNNGHSVPIYTQQTPAAFLPITDQLVYDQMAIINDTVTISSQPLDCKNRPVEMAGGMIILTDMDTGEAHVPVHVPLLWNGTHLAADLVVTAGSSLIQAFATTADGNNISYVPNLITGAVVVIDNFPIASAAFLLHPPLTHAGQSTMLYLKVSAAEVYESSLADLRMQATWDAQPCPDTPVLTWSGINSYMGEVSAPCTTTQGQLQTLSMFAEGQLVNSTTLPITVYPGDTSTLELSKQRGGAGSMTITVDIRDLCDQPMSCPNCTLSVDSVSGPIPSAVKLAPGHHTLVLQGPAGEDLDHASFTVPSPVLWPWVLVGGVLLGGFVIIILVRRRNALLKDEQNDVLNVGLIRSAQKEESDDEKEQEPAPIAEPIPQDVVREVPRLEEPAPPAPSFLPKLEEVRTPPFHPHPEPDEGMADIPV